jgi:DNA-directed RNA polymerase subunit RPC12/RpoP
MTDQGNTIQPPDGKKAKSLQEMAAEGGSDPGGGRVQFCPSCRRRLFKVEQTWYKRDGTKRRAYKCAACGHVDSSSVTEVFDGDE